MKRETFDINIENKKLSCLKELVLEQDIGVNNLIENLLDNYIKRENVKQLQRRKITFSTQVPQRIIEELQEKGVYLKEYKILQSIETRFNFTDEFRNREGIIYEKVAEITLLELETRELYLLRYDWIITDREFQGEDIVNVSIYKKQDKESTIRGIEYLWKDKLEYQNYDREIFVDGLGIRFMPSEKFFNNYVRDTILTINNIAIQDFIKENN